MKSLASLLAGIAFVVLSFVIGLPLATILVSQPVTHQFAHLNDPPMWTSEPVVIDRMAQLYEREDHLLPDQDTGMSAAASASRVEKGEGVANPANTVGSTDRQVAEVAATTSNAAAVLDDAQIAWCTQRYRSYRAEDNTYRSFGGERRTCEPPGNGPAADGQVVVSTVQPWETTSSAEPAMSAHHQSWCAARYSSYRAEDNSYQPYQGPRRSCQSPYATDSASSNAPAAGSPQLTQM